MSFVKGRLRHVVVLFPFTEKGMYIFLLTSAEIFFNRGKFELIKILFDVYIPSRLTPGRYSFIKEILSKDYILNRSD